MFEAVADTMAAAIRNADLYRSEQWRRQVADSLRDVAGLVSGNAVRVIPDRAELARRLAGTGRRFSPERDAVAELVAERATEG